MVKTLLVRLALTTSHVGLVACLVAGLASGLSYARDDDGESLSGCPQGPGCTVAAPDRTCYDYVCLQEPDNPVCTNCVCTPQCNKSCACVLTAIPDC